MLGGQFPRRKERIYSLQGGPVLDICVFHVVTNLFVLCVLQSMVQTQNEFPWFQLSILLVVGAIAAGVAFWLVDHRTAVPNSEIIIAILLGTFFVSFSWALIRFLRWRDRRRGVPVPGQSYNEELAGTVYGLVPGAAYRVVHRRKEYARRSHLERKTRAFARLATECRAIHSRRRGSSASGGESKRNGRWTSVILGTSPNPATIAWLEFAKSNRTQRSTLITNYQLPAV